MKYVISVGLCMILSVLNTSAQGPLTPPGPPAPMMKTLDQIEPRTPISSVPYIITQSGSYYLTTNLTVSNKGEIGITVNANNVTIDLNGFTLEGPRDTDGYADGIIQTNTNACGLTIQNGTIELFWTGVFAGESCRLQNMTFLHCNVVTVGAYSSIGDCLVRGHTGITGAITTGSHSIIRDCTADRGAIFAGDDCAISGCTINGNYSARGAIKAGSGSTVTDCTAQGTDAPSISAGDGCIISQCAVTAGGAPSDAGIVAGSGCVIINCTATGSAYFNPALSVGSGCTLINCTVELTTVSGSGALGISTGSDSTISNCKIVGGAKGIVAGSSSMIRGCTVSSNNTHGIQVDSGCKVIDNTCDNSGSDDPYIVGIGIRATGIGNRIDGNHVTGSDDYGFRVEDVGNIIVRNTASGNTTNYDIAAGNDVGTIQTTPVHAGAWDNFEF